MSDQILLVEIGRETKSTAARLLAKIDTWSVAQVRTADKALDQLAKGNDQTSILVVDIRHDTADALAFCARLKATDWKDLPLLVIAESDQDADLAKAMMAGALDFIAAPVTAAKLSTRIKSVMRLQTEIARGRKKRASQVSAGADAGVRPCATALLCARAGFEAAIMALEPSCAAKCGMIVLRHTGAIRNRAELTAAQHRDLTIMMGDILAGVPMPAGELLASLGDYIYVHAVLGCDATALDDKATQYKAAVDASALTGFPKDALEIHVAIAQPGSADTLAQSLADAILASDPGQDGRPLNDVLHQ